MSATSQAASIAGRPVTLHGDADDPYFGNVAAVIEALAPLRCWVQANLATDSVVIDAGGNIGLTALMLSHLLPDGHVHVFEALPANAAYLRQNVDANGIGNVSVNAVALGDRPGRVAMRGVGSSSHVAPSGPAGIAMVTLDGYVAEAGLARVDFVKMDVEGFEPAVLAGAAGLIERFRPPILMEFNTWCLAHVQGFEARTFAMQLWDAFEVASLNPDGTETQAGGGDVGRFFHDNVVLHGTVEDVLLRPRPGERLQRLARAATASDMARLASDVERLRDLVLAMEASTSWRVTAPLRAVGRLLGRRS